MYDPYFHRLAKVLIDPGAIHSFVNPNFMSGIDMKPIKYLMIWRLEHLLGIKV